MEKLTNHPTRVEDATSRIRGINQDHAVPRQVCQISVIDPDTQGEVAMTVFKDDGGGMWAVDSSFLEQCEDEPVFNPMTGREENLDEVDLCEQSPEGQQQKDYVNSEGINCPFCDSVDLSTSDREGHGAIITQGVRCDKCHKEWDDFYQLTHFEVVQATD